MMKREDEREIDGYLEAQLVADIKKAKQMEGTKARTARPQEVKVKRTSASENEEYEFLAEDDVKLPTIDLVHGLIFCRSDFWDSFKQHLHRALAFRDLNTPTLIFFTSEIFANYSETIQSFLDPNLPEGELSEGAFLEILRANGKLATTPDHCLYGLVAALYLRALKADATVAETTWALEAMEALLGKSTRKNLDFMEDAGWGIRGIHIVALRDVWGLTGVKIPPWEVDEIFKTPKQLLSDANEPDAQVKALTETEVWEVGVHASLTAEVLTMLERHMGIQKFARLIEKQYPSFVKEKCSEFFSQLSQCPTGTEGKSLAVRRILEEEIPWSDESNKPHGDIDRLQLKIEQAMESHKPDLILCTVPWMCLLLANLGVPIVGYFGHPPLFMVKDEKKGEVVDRLRLMAERQDVAFVVTDPFLQMQYRYQLGVELPYIRTSAEYIPFVNDPVFERDVLVWDRPYDMALFAAIQEVIDQQGSPRAHLDGSFPKAETKPNDGDPFMRYAIDGDWRFLGRHALIDRTYSNLRKFKAIVIYPYDMDLVAFYEFYRMNVPIFMPRSLEKYLFKQGHMQYEIGVRLAETEKPMSDASRWNLGFSAFNETNPFVTMEQLTYSDYFRFPGIQFFDNISDLLDKIKNTDFMPIKAEMRAFWETQHHRCVQMWRKEVARVLLD